MKILSIDTSCKTAMAAVSEDDTILASVQILDQKTHSVKMLPAVASILSSAGVVPAELGLIAVTNGPGSYTGLRIGVTTAKTFAYALGIPLIGIDSLEALAAACDVCGTLPVCPLIDARNERVYASLYENGKALMKTSALSCKELCEKLKEEYGGREILFTGDGSVVNAELLADLLGQMYKPVPVAFSMGNPAAISLLARKKYAAASAGGLLGECTAERLRVEYYKNYTASI